MRLTPPPGKKLVRDWIGLRVRVLREMSNGYGKIPAGTEGKILGTSSGLRIEMDECKHCRRAFYITRVHPRDVSVVPG